MSRDQVKLDVKLTTMEPLDRIDEFVKAGADIITFMPESAKQPMAVIQKIKKHEGVKAGIVLNPSMAMSTVEELIPHCDVVVVMLVNAGHGTKPYKSIEEQTARVKRVREAVGPHIRVEVDGGVKESSAAALIAAGADTLIAGGAVFSSDDPAHVIGALKGED